jgi:hypothetical protein
MAYRNKTYVAFDGDKDMWAYRFMKGWKSLKNIDFNFYDAHDLKKLTDKAKDETYIKRVLRERLKNSKEFILLVGESTKNLRKYVKWEIEIAIELDIPIIVVNLNDTNGMDENLCPKSLKTHLSIHGPFRKDFIVDALKDFSPNYKDHKKEYGTDQTLYFKKEYV